MTPPLPRVCSSATSTPHPTMRAGPPHGDTGAWHGSGLCASMFLPGRAVVSVSQGVSFRMRSAALVFLVSALAAASADARPTGPSRFCAVYPESSTCAGRGTTCTLCHTSTSPQAPDWNAYGIHVLGSLTAPFDEPGALEDALHAVEADDDDGDGLTNLEEIILGTLPGDATSYYVPPPPGIGDPNPVYDVGNWDPAFAMRRMMVAFCGRSPTYDEMQALAAAADGRAFVHDKLDECLGSDYWTGDGLAHLADERIKPIDLGTSFLWDYRLWRYVLTGDRDVRDLLLADYHVREPVEGQLVQVDDVVDDNSACNANSDCAFDSHCDSGACKLNDGGQPLERDQRAGMIGTQWFHFINTMFSAMPRTTAAQAMRAYLGMDIARQQGINPVVNEPLDVDGKGVQQEECAQCHATLDPATYVFAKYRGIEAGGASGFDPNRPIAKGLWTAETEPQGMLLGHPVSTLREWAGVAAASDAFQMNLARMFFVVAVGRPPGPQDKAEFDALWPSWASAEVAFSANRFLHKLVDTNAFGAP